MPQRFLHFSYNYPNGAVNFPNIQTLVNDAGVTFTRIGGDQYDSWGDSIGVDAAHNDYIAAMEAVRAINPTAKFLIQIPFAAGNFTFTPAKAKTLVANISAHFNGEQFYYTIGNEWNNYKVGPQKRRYFVSDIATNIKTFAVEMKSADSTILIVAPALTHFAATDSVGTNILQVLLSGSGGANDISGVITGSTYGYLNNRKYYVDVIDFHSYAGGGTAYGNMSGTDNSNYATRRQASIDFPYGNFTTDLSNGTNKMQALLTQANNGHLRTGANALTYAITEMNIAWKNDTLIGQTDTSRLHNTVFGIADRSYFAGQYWADLISAMLKNGTSYNNIKFVCPWSVCESSGDGSTYDLGMTKDSATSTLTPKPLSTYWHYQMMAKHFSGTYLPNLLSFSAGTKYKAFAYKNTTEIGVIIMNQNEQSSPRGSDNSTVFFDINFYNTSPGSSPIQFAFAANNTAIGTGGLYTCNITKETSQLLVFDITSGALIRKEVYTIGDAMRTADTGPEVWVSPTAVPITLQSEFDFHTNQIYKDLLISPTSGITEGNSDTKVFKFTNTATVNGSFTVPAGATFSIIPTANTCP